MGKFCSINWISFLLLFILACGNPINLQDIRSAGALYVTSVSIVNNQLIVYGQGFQEIRGLALSDPSTGFYKPFTLSSYTTKKIVGLNQNALPISVPSVLMKLIIDTADGASSTPVTFTLQTDAVYTGAIQDQAVTLEKLSTAGAQEGDVIIYEGGQFVLAPPASGGSGTGGVDKITFGEGIVGAPGSSTATNVAIAVNVGTTGSSTSTYIPYYNADKELEISNTAKLVFSNPTPDENFAVFNNGSFEISVEDGSTSGTFYPLISVTKDGDVSITSPPTIASPTLTVGGESVCLGDGSGCPPALTGTITTINGISPIKATTPYALGTTVDISAKTGTATGDLVILGAGTPGSLPAVDGSQVLNIVTKILPSTGITVSPASGTGTVTLNLAVGGTGTAQPWDQALTDISNIVYPPLSGQLIMGNGSGYIASAYSLPTLACLNGYVLSSDGTNFVCATSVSSFNIRTGAVMPQAGDYNAGQITNTPSGQIAATNVQAALNELDSEKLALAGGTMTGTIITTTQNAIQLGPFAGITGELRFNELAVNGVNYVGFKGPDAIPGINVIWTLPPIDGNNGQLLSTNGNKVLGWTSIGVGGVGDVVGPASASSTNLASYNGTTGKLIQDSGIASTNVVQMTTLPLQSFVMSSIPGSKNITQSTILISDVPTMLVGAASANNLILSDAANKTQKATVFTVPPGVCPNGQSWISNGTNYICNLTTGNVTGPGLSTDNAVARFDLTTGKIIQNSGVIISDTNGVDGITTLNATGNTTIGGTLGVTGATTLSSSLAISGQTTFNSGANSSTFPLTRGTLDQVLTTNGAGALSWTTNANGDVIGPLPPVVDNNLVSFNGTGGKIIKDSGLATANIPTMANNGTLNHPVLSGGSNKTLVNAGYSIPSAVCATGEVLKSNGTNMTCQVDNGDVSSVAPFTANNLTAFVDATGKTIKDSGISVNNVVTNTSGSTDNAIARFDTASGKLIQNSVVTISDGGDLSGVASFTSTGNFSVGGAGSFTGALSAQSYSNNSDRSLKKNIQPFTGAASIVDKLMPVSFRWKSGDEKPVIGLIAQDVEKVIPEVISISSQKGKTIRSYDVGQVLILTLEALKETREELKQTRNELRAFQEKVKELEKRIPQKFSPK